MEFAWSEVDTERYARVLRGAGEPLEQALRSDDPKAPWRLAGELGLLGACVPAREGGLGLGALATARVLEAAGRACADSGFVFAAAAHLLACAMPIATHGSSEQRARWLPALCRGDAVGALAMTEASSGSDAFAMSATATRDGDRYVLEGHKAYVTNSPRADVVVVFASTQRSHGHLGISAFLVEPKAHAATAGPPHALIAFPGAQVGDLSLAGCTVPVAARLGGEGEGASIFQTAMRWERACLFAVFIGMMERQLSETIERARERRQGRRAIAQHQAVAHRIADMKIRLEGARLLVYRACWEIDNGEAADLAISIAKVAVSDAAVQSGLDAVQIYAAAGLRILSAPAQALMDALATRIVSGTSEVQRNLIARGLGL